VKFEVTMKNTGYNTMYYGRNFVTLQKRPYSEEAEVAFSSKTSVNLCNRIHSDSDISQKTLFLKWILFQSYAS